MLGIMTYSKLLAYYTPAYTFMLACCSKKWYFNFKFAANTICYCKYVPLNYLMWGWGTLAF